MKFTQISEADFREFAAKSPYQSFMQTPEIASYRQSLGWAPYYFAVTGDPKTPKNPKIPKTSKLAKTAKNAQSSKSATQAPKILAASLVLAKPTFLGYQTFFTPGGPLLELEDTKLTKFFFTHLADFAKTHRGLALQIDPYYELIERDRKGQPVPGGFHHQKALQNLTSLGFREINSSQPKYLFALDIAGRTPDELFKNFKSNTRGHIRHAERAGVKVRELGREELGILKSITKSTAARRGFSDQPLAYYEAMYDLFTPVNGIKFLVAEADIDGQTTPLSVAMFMLTGNEIVYLYSGSDQQYMKSHNAQYAIQWHIIKYAAEHGFPRYNFYGIFGLPDKSAKDYGIYSFKKGFDGHVIELIGSYALPLNQPIYHLHATLSRLKNLLHG